VFRQTLKSARQTSLAYNPDKLAIDPEPHTIYFCVMRFICVV